MMKKKILPSVAICIPTFNQNKTYFEECIRSAVAQNYENLSIVVSVNVGDQTADAILTKFSDPRIKVVRPDDHLEMAANFDFCLSHANCDFVSFLCSDDMMLDDCIIHLVEQLQLHKDASFCTGNLIRAESYPESVAEQKKFLLRADGLNGYFAPLEAKKFLFPWRMESTWMTACLIRRGNISQNAPFTNSPFLVWGDMWLTLMLLDKGGLVVSSNVTGFYRQRGSSERTAYGNRTLFDYCDLLTCKRLDIPHESLIFSKNPKRLVVQLIKRAIPTFLIFIVILFKSSPNAHGVSIVLKSQSLNVFDRLVLKLWLLAKKVLA
jgi:glycosyltransferase involved in cell wall biosynthesis